MSQKLSDLIPPGLEPFYVRGCAALLDAWVWRLLASLIVLRWVDYGIMFGA